MLQGVGSTPLPATINSNSYTNADIELRIADLSAEAICELILKQLDHPDFSAMKNEVRQAHPDWTPNQIHNKVLDKFKQSDSHRTLAEQMFQTRNTLCSLFQNMADQNSIQTALNTLFDRSGLTGLAATHQSSFGNQTLNVLELTCLRLKQLAHLSRVARQNPALIKGKEPIDTLKVAVKEIALEVEFCAPGLIQKTEDTFTDVKLRLFPPSLESKVRTLHEQICRQVIREFCDETYSHENTYNASEVHYVAAWQNILRSAQGDYYFLPEINDIYSPNLPDDEVNRTHLQTLCRKLQKQANLSKVFVNIGLEILNELRSTLGDRSSELSNHYPAFKDIFRALNTRYEVLKESDLIEFESDALSIKLSSKPNPLAIRLLANFSKEFFVPKTVIANQAESVYGNETLYWTGTDNPNDGNPINSVSLEDLTEGFLNDVLTHPGERAHPDIDLLLDALHNSDPASLDNFINSAHAKKFGFDSLRRVHPSCIADKAGAAHILAMAMFHRDHLNNTQTDGDKRLGFSLKESLETLAKRKIPISYFDPQATQVLIAGIAKQTNDIDITLRAATMWNNAEVMDALLNELKQTGRLSITDKKPYQKAAEWAGSFGQMAARAGLLKHIGALNSNTANFYPVLRYLIAQGDLLGARFALENGANPNVKSSREYSRVSALRHAMMSDRPSIVEELIKHGADLQETWTGDTGKTINPLLYAEMSAKSRITNLLREAGATPPAGQADLTDPMLQAIEGERYSTAARLLHERGQINRKFYKNKTILHLAARVGDIASIRYAIELGANINAQSSQLTGKKTPLIVAIKYAKLHTVQTLLELGANPFLRFADRRADTYAQQKGNTQIYNMVRQAIADRNEANRAHNRARVRAAGQAIRRVFIAEG